MLSIFKRPPCRSLHNVRLPQKIFGPISAEEITRLLAAYDPKSPVGDLDRAILLVLLGAGIRCSELVQLNLDDLDLEAGRLRILHAKDNKQRVISFVSPCRQALPRCFGLRGYEPDLHSWPAMATGPSDLDTSSSPMPQTDLDTTGGPHWHPECRPIVSAIPLPPGLFKPMPEN